MKQWMIAGVGIFYLALTLTPSYADTVSIDASEQPPQPTSDQNTDTPPTHALKSQDPVSATGGSADSASSDAQNAHDTSKDTSDTRQHKAK